MFKIYDEIMEEEIMEKNSYIKESFNFPPEQNFPIHHCEVKSFLIVGNNINKTELATSELALNAYEIWRDNIDFFIAQDNIHALIDAISTSKKAVHYVVLNGNVLYMNKYYLTLVHGLRKRTGLMNYNLGGIIICAVLVQSKRDIGPRLRHNMMFSISNWEIHPNDEKYKNLPFKFVKIENKEV